MITFKQPLQPTRLTAAVELIVMFLGAMKNIADYSKYKCPFSDLPKDCRHELHGPEGWTDDNQVEDAFRIWCPCGFRGPALCIDPDELKLEKKDNQKDSADQKRAIREFYNEENDDLTIKEFRTKFGNYILNSPIIQERRK